MTSGTALTASCSAFQRLNAILFDVISSFNLSYSRVFWHKLRQKAWRWLILIIVKVPMTVNAHSCLLYWPNGYPKIYSDTSHFHLYPLKNELTQQSTVYCCCITPSPTVVDVTPRSINRQNFRTFATSNQLFDLKLLWNLINLRQQNRKRTKMSKSSIFRKLLKILLIQSLLWLVKGEKFVFPFGNGTSDTDLLSAENDWRQTYDGMGYSFWWSGEGDGFCSFDLKLSREIRFGAQIYDTIFACASGYIYFGPRYPDPFFPHASSSDLNEKARMIPFMHEVRMDWDENRYDNHLFFRELSSGDLQIMAGIVTEHTDLKRFEPDWGFVVTWDEIENECNSWRGTFAGARNSFQAAFVCDGAKTDKNVEDDDCYVMYDFYMTEDGDRSDCSGSKFWFAEGENFARSGFKDGKSKYCIHCIFAAKIVV